ncbi:glutathione S-transferase family protein [Roseomonas sp. CCTCC AB2023176]|uniref:glutathione S-transferase family protein n=1 Tax=Roseomonas sp. CCTCC AB2023176 TaxID=3342640 RepID=UPI0035D53FE7
MTEPRFLLHHAPRSRSGRILWLLEEASAPYDLVWHSLAQGTHKRDDYLLKNPHGKVPTLEDRGPEGAWGDVIITESAAICAYLADLLPEARLAPAVGTRARASYATWMAYANGVLEPAMADQAFPRAKTAPASALGWPAFSEAVARVEGALARGPWLLGSHFSAADVMVGALLAWVVGWGMLQPGPNVSRYLAEMEARPARQRALAREDVPA